MMNGSVYSIDAGLPFARDLAAGVIKLAASPEGLARSLSWLCSCLLCTLLFFSGKQKRHVGVTHSQQ